MIYNLFARALTALFYFCQYLERISKTKAIYSSTLKWNKPAKTSHKVFFNTMFANHNNQLFSMMDIYPYVVKTEIGSPFFNGFRFFKSIVQVHNLTIDNINL
jgi:hypothetical protein